MKDWLKWGLAGAAWGIVYGYIGVFAEGIQPYFTVDYFWKFFPNNFIAVMSLNIFLWIFLFIGVGYIYGRYKK